MAHFPCVHSITIRIWHGHLQEPTYASHNERLVVTLFTTGFYHNLRPDRTLPKHIVTFYDW